VLEDLQRKIYSRILRNLTEHFRQPDEAQLCRDLRPAYAALWDSYRSGQVDARYSNDETVAAYLLAYYPNYVFAARAMWERVALPSSTEALVICGGPAPEIVGLASVIHDRYRDASIQVMVVDASAERWRWGGEVSSDLCRHFFGGTQVNVQYSAANICEPYDAPKAVHVTIAQNCLNELASNDGFIANVKSIAKALVPGGHMIFVDRANYEIVQDRLRTLEAALVSPWELRPNVYLLPVVRDNFFDGPGLDSDGRFLPGRHFSRTLNLVSLVVRKAAS
jgi:SAM-dependent methyltransferase